MITVTTASSTTTTAWFTLAGALGGVLVTSVVALTTAVLNHRWQRQNEEEQLLREHSRQLRVERREVFVHYWSAWNRLNHQLRAVRDAIQDLDPGPTPRDRLDAAVPDLVQGPWTAELDWREASDAVLLIGGQAVVDAAAAHVGLTERKISAAWEGTSHRDENGETYRRLNDAMRSELLQPLRL